MATETAPGPPAELDSGRTARTPPSVTSVHARAHGVTTRVELGMRAEKLRRHVERIALDETVFPLEDSFAVAGVEDDHEDFGPDRAPVGLAHDRDVAELVLVEEPIGIEGRNHAAVPGEQLAQVPGRSPDGIVRMDITGGDAGDRQRDARHRAGGDQSSVAQRARATDAPVLEAGDPARGQQEFGTAAGVSQTGKD